MKFEEMIEELRQNVGQRNGMLMRVVMTGLNEGISPEDIRDRLADGAGDPPLTDQEIVRAISRSKEYLSGEPNSGRRFEVAMTRVQKEIDGTSPEDRSFVRRMIAIGEGAMKRTGMDATELIAADMAKRMRGLGSPYGSIPLRRAMATEYLRARFGKDELFFATDNIKADRDKTRIYDRERLIEDLGSDKPFKNNVRSFNPLRLFDYEKRDVPTHVSVNPVSGESIVKNGKASYANGKTVTRFCYALVEFDGIGSIEETCGKQSEFWYGVISTNSLNVVTLTYTVGKSIHGIVELPELKQGDDLFGGVSREAAESYFKLQTAKLSRMLCSDEDVQYRCDRNALCDAARLTRMPGGLRDRGLPHLLVWARQGI